jgi:hypothetical protein
MSRSLAVLAEARQCYRRGVEQLHEVVFGHPMLTLGRHQVTELLGKAICNNLGNFVFRATLAIEKVALQLLFRD